jgi:5-formaminoimidazole-4-carboxamide-1-(beta)-D-ribofuranosyl 5'-monophosphate synthetase
VWKEWGWEKKDEVYPKGVESYVYVLRGTYMRGLVAGYDLERLSIATLASHSSLQIFHGAKMEGFRTVAIVVKDRLWFYEQFKHLIDYFIVLNSWGELCRKDVVEKLRSLNAILVPHGSYVEYVGLDCAENIEVPIFGLRKLFRVEADQKAKMELLQRAGIPTPKIYRIDDDIDRLVIVKLPGAKGGKGYFLAKSKDEVVERLKKYIKEGLIKSFDDVIIQEYVIGVTAYYHYFYSPILNRVEILGADIRYETNVDGLRRLPPKISINLDLEPEPSFVVVGNIPLVLRESLLPRILEYGIKFVEETKRSLPPGIIGPFCLESVINDNMEIKVFEFSGRIVAGTNIYINGSPYSYLYWNEPMSTSRRIAREIKLAIDRNELEKVLT